MPKFELSKSLEGVKVNKRSGIPTSERVTLSFGAIIEDPKEDRDNLRFIHLGEMYDVKLSEIQGYYRSIDGGPLPVSAITSPGARTVADTRLIRWETIPSNLPTQRARVPGGWLVAAGGGVTFLPDPTHEWEGSSL